MGDEAQCRLRFQGAVSFGRALLETDALIFRGHVRLAVPYRDIRRLDASDGRLKVAFPGGVAVFELGTKAAAWADKIRHPKTVLDKLGVKAGSQVTVLNVPDRQFRANLAARGVSVSSRRSKNAGLMFLGVSAKRDLHRLRSLAGRLRPDGAIWVVAPRGSAALREADVLAAGKPAGLVDVKIVRFSETHTAHKFVIPVSRRPRVV